ncbi:Uncharacterized protein Adt_45199 [Abeliophyllum distichum]|uniref:Uncharacterized protein n=1 Tax=Abeliophyllum distichum TaxID=126358 RepID=A0ABD1PD01_9LAMI
MNSRWNYAKVARKEPIELSSSWTPTRTPPIMFTKEDEAGFHYLNCGTFVIRAIVAKNGLGRMLVDDGSAMNILFSSAFDQMEVDHELTTISELLLNFTEDSLISSGRITLAVDLKKPLCHVKNSWNSW